MARFRLVLTINGVQVRLSYGHSRWLGFYVEARQCVGGRWSKVVDYSLLDGNYRGLPGLLDVLVDSGVFARDTVEAALEGLLVVDDLADIEDADVRCVAEIVFNVKQAAGE